MRTPANGARFDPITCTIRTSLATWLRHGPQWVVDFRDLARVELTDRRPCDWLAPAVLARGHNPERTPGWSWGFGSPAGVAPAAILPQEVAAHLPALTFAAEADALDALSAALIAWAKEQTP